METSGRTENRMRNSLRTIVDPFRILAHGIRKSERIRVKVKPAIERNTFDPTFRSNAERSLLSRAYVNRVPESLPLYFGYWFVCIMFFGLLFLCVYVDYKPTRS